MSRSYVVPTEIHHITTVRPGALRTRRGLADCPREHASVDVSVCVSCPHARGSLGGRAGADGRHSMLCAVDRREAVQTAPASVGSFMRHEVVCVRPDVDLDDVVLLFAEHAHGGMPVVDENDMLIGIISKTDLVASYARRGRGRCCGELLDSFDADAAVEGAPRYTRDIMTDVVLTLRENDPLWRAAEPL
jgi:CBS domain-containing protein